MFCSVRCQRKGPPTHFLHYSPLVNWSFDSGDSIGATPAESNAAHDKLVKDHPSSVLALNHEVYSKFLFFSFDIR